MQAGKIRGAAVAAAAALTLGISGLANAAVDIDYVSDPDPNLAIPDNDPNGLTDSIDVDVTGTIKNLQVFVHIDHTWVGDLLITLTSPNGDVITLMDRPGVPDISTVGYSTNLSASLPLVFDDSFTTPSEDAGASCPGGTNGVVGQGCTRFFMPTDALSAVAGADLLGTWTVFISDNAAADTGELDRWRLRFTYNPVPVPAAVWLLGSALLGLGAMRRRAS